MGQIWSAICANNQARQDRYKVEEEPKQFSWDKPMDRDPSQYIFDSLPEGSTAVKMPGDINGQQFVVQNCKNVTILLFDHTASVNVDDCEDCRILIGPCKGSVFIRDCKRLSVLVICQQFRSRDCNDIRLAIHSTTYPIIEESRKMQFTCLRLHYPQLTDQLFAAQISPFNNNWSKVHDFTPEDRHYSYLDEDLDLSTLITVPDRWNDVVLPTTSFDAANSETPLTLGERQPNSNEMTFLLCLSDRLGKSDLIERCMKIVRHVQHSAGSDSRLRNARQVAAEDSDLARIIGHNNFAKLAKNGPIIGMEWRGSDTEQLLKTVIQDTPALFALYTGTEAKKILQNFNGFSDAAFSV